MGEAPSLNGDPRRDAERAAPDRGWRRSPRPGGRSGAARRAAGRTGLPTSSDDGAACVRILVVRSIEDATGDRCVDLLRDGASHAWVECRRDPEDGHGWRRLHPPRAGFVGAAEALSAAVGAVGWLEEAAR